MMTPSKPTLGSLSVRLTGAFLLKVLPPSVERAQYGAYFKLFGSSRRSNQSTLRAPSLPTLAVGKNWSWRGLVGSSFTLSGSLHDLPPSVDFTSITSVSPEA